MWTRISVFGDDQGLKNLLKIQIFWIGVELERPCSSHHPESITTYFVRNKLCMLPETCSIDFPKQGNFLKNYASSQVSGMYC